MPRLNAAHIPAILLCCLAILQLHPLVNAAADREDAFETWSESTADCRDHESACEDWAHLGECDKNPGFMKTRCPLACKLCKAPEVKPADYAGQMLVLNCSLGQIRIRPYFDRAPLTAALVMELAHHPSGCGGGSGAGGASGCAFYRNEAVPQEGDGPPYGLLQGSLPGMLQVPPKEGGEVEMRRGHVAMITNTREFFISAMRHPGWGASMTVWGELADEASLRVVEALLGLPYSETKHPAYGTVMRMLRERVPFVPGAVMPGAAATTRAAL